ncbi:hypothetical protein AN639_00050 [Candidatus Epulonipiscium fishelsonii]|uniref:Uncharacterized protein n=2 Tax=Candidatus Epulonipiscium fishelsonii TaxID=77094 RepID=A0ACC8XES0_9FIRM|nr:hypothetical protein AN396_05975 [Epulopiscium sp. SCG-B11WGA-EpuloA1]ONI41608.1 hypothetical protein AN396_03360 [Epulopiscium sp. SCG-B11WGA-EpuloA1]ONI43920.1 hypothetical protein AN639_00050 [Epulopiscium sp. SCG-B05WGA-EpuloA1]
MNLTQYEQDMLNGKYGEFKKAALKKVVEYGIALGAEELCEVTKATLYFGAHPYLETTNGKNYDEVFSKMYLCSDETIKMGEFAEGCFCQTCVAPCDHYQYEPLHLTKELFDKNREYLDITKEAGVSIVGSCTPYFGGWIPLKGEHFVTTESSNVLMCNSVFGACGNSDGIEAAAWSAVCGRTPKWGNHILENRKANVVYNIECKLDTATEWDVVGYTVGRMLPPHAIPALVGDFKRPTIIKLKQCFASMATTSGAEMCHIVDVTPEAPTLEIALGGKEPEKVFTITQEDYNKSLRMLCDEGEAEINIIALGCPHYTLEEVRDVANYIKGKKIKEGIDFFVWTDYSIKEMAVQNGYVDIIKEAGGDVMTSGCPLVMGKKNFEHAIGFVSDGAKQAHYIRSDLQTGVPVYYGDMYTCIDAGINGKWGGK